MLGALHVVTDEGDVDSGLQHTDVRAVHLDLVNDSVGQTLQSSLDSQDEGVEVRGISVVLNGDGGEGLVQSGGEGQSEGVVIIDVRLSIRDEQNRLHLVLSRGSHIQALIHDISTELAHSLGAIDISVFRVADAATSLGTIPLVVGEGLGLLLDEVSVLPVLGNRGIGHVLDISAASVARAIVGASSSLASTTLIAGEALALTTVTVADTSVGALSVLVVGANLVGSINPSDIIRADSLRAVTRQVRQTQAPIVVTSANTSLTASSVAGTRVITTSLNGGQNRNEN